MSDKKDTKREPIFHSGSTDKKKVKEGLVDGIVKTINEERKRRGLPELKK